MEKKDNVPMWVFLAFSSINTRKGALILIWSSFIFTIYCIPFSLFFTEQEWVKQLFLIDNWDWLVMMAPVVLWYYLCLRWMDKNNEWPSN